MLIREGSERTAAINFRLAVLFAAIAGALNAAGFQATGFFSANMTGNASAVSDHFGLGNLASAGFLLSLIVAFIAGAFVSGLLIEFGRQRRIAAIYAYSVTLEGVIVLLSGFVDLFGGGATLLVICLSCAMGVQNAATTRISDARVRTTHVSGMATDIGLGLAGLIIPSPDSRETTARLRLYGWTFIVFLISGVIGVLAYLAIGPYFVIMMGLLLLGIAIPEARRAGSAAGAQSQ